MNNLPLVNIFEIPCELWETRSQTLKEMMESGDLHKVVNVRLEAKIENHLDAAMYILIKEADRRLECFIKDYLNSSPDYHNMRREMPSQTPLSLSNYQRKFQSNTFEQVSADIETYGRILSDGQYLFHGGLWPVTAQDGSFVTNRPFSSSFCPQIAIRNAEWGGKAYDAGELNLFVLRATNPKTKTFCFRLNGTDKGHEAEVLFAAGAKLTLRSKTFIKHGLAYKVCSQGTGNIIKKQIPFYLLEVDIA